MIDPTQTPPPSDPAAPAPRRVLVVDDATIMRKVVALFLTELGWAVTVASSGEEGLGIGQDPAGEAFDLLVTDLGMPGMNGREFALQFIEISPKTKVIYMSGFTEAVVESMGVDVRQECFLPKPVPAGALRQAIHQLFGDTP